MFGHDILVYVEVTPCELIAVLGHSGVADIETMRDVVGTFVEHVKRVPVVRISERKEVPRGNPSQ